MLSKSATPAHPPSPTDRPRRPQIAESEEIDAEISWVAVEGSRSSAPSRPREAAR